jgi:hypothetical protein
LDVVPRVWAERVDACISRVAERMAPSPCVVHPADKRTPGVTTVDWTGFPLRVASCLGREDALALLDWLGPSGCEGRLRLQEEYVEWRVVREGDGGIRRVELTTELADRWRVMAAHAPAEALRIVAEFAGEEGLPNDALFGTLDPFAPGVSPEEREEAFAATMLTPTSPYNNGELALSCMVHPSNSLEAIAALVCAAAFAFTADGIEGRCLSARVTIPLLAGAAQDGRASDPLIVERLGRLAFEGRLVALDDPVGVFIQGVEHTRLRCPDGRPVPAAWFTYGRDAAPGTASTREARFQRVALEAPADERLRVSDLVDVATERPIAFGGQIAELVQLALYLRVSAPGATEVEPRRSGAPSMAVDPTGCAAVRQAWAEYTKARQIVR